MRAEREADGALDSTLVAGRETSVKKEQAALLVENRRRRHPIAAESAKRLHLGVV